MKESLKIVEQCLDRLQPGPVMVADKKIAWPAQLALGGDGLGNSLDHIRHIMGESMEALIHHFKLVTEGFRVPPGQVYSAIESPRGELGVHLVSDGGTRPYRVHFRDPSFNNLQAAPAMSRGQHDRRRHRGHRLDRPRDGWGGPVTEISSQRTGFDADTLARLESDADQIIARYPRARSALLPMLHLVQSEEGYVSPHGIEFCAERLGLTTAEVAAVATFYTMYKRRPIGDYTVGVCTNTLCAVMGGDEIFATLKEHLGVGNDETTDGRHGHPRARRVQRGLRLRAGGDGQLGVLRQPDAGVGGRARRRPAGRATCRRRPAAPRLCTFSEVARVLAGFPDGRADEGPAAGPATLAGLQALPRGAERRPPSQGRLGPRRPRPREEDS